ncbi:uncharacterized protein LOC127087186 [Lathyrus oleraceus]|uniref:uncharacterized protein LOC127087186 n=1 Tax=Pisum sativum TaxID=3888 RepID=UPI0021D019D9|nr:uncharacterized protein LOC127087186 [Pisum sativum]
MECYRLGHRAAKCKSAGHKCFEYGKQGNGIAECKNNAPTCYNYGEPGHISIQCQKLRKAPASAQASGRVFAFSSVDVSISGNLIQGMCFINSVTMIAIIDTGATYLFVSLDCVKKLNLNAPYMIGSMVIDTPTNGSVTISLVCLNCSLTIYGKEFGVDLICFPLNQLDVTFRMNWIEFNWVYIDYFDKTVLFLELEESKDLKFMYAGQVKMSLREDDKVIMMLTSLRVERDVMANDIPMVCAFSDVFLEDICDLLVEQEVELAMDLVPGTRHV